MCTAVNLLYSVQHSSDPLVVLVGEPQPTFSLWSRLLGLRASPWIDAPDMRNAINLEWIAWTDCGRNKCDSWRCPAQNVRIVEEDSELCGLVGYCQRQCTCLEELKSKHKTSSPLSIYFLIFSPFYFSLSFICFTYFLLLSIPSLSTRIVPLRFQAGGRRRRPNLALVCVLLCNLCYLYSLVKMHCVVLFYLVYICVFFSAFTLLVGSFDP